MVRAYVKTLKRVVEAYTHRYWPPTFNSYLLMDWVKHHIGRRPTRLHCQLCRVIRVDIHPKGTGKIL